MHLISFVEIAPLDCQEASTAEFGPPHKSSVPKMNGGTMPVVYDEANFRARYLDEYTGEVLGPSLIRAAIEDAVRDVLPGR